MSWQNKKRIGTRPILGAFIIIIVYLAVVLGFTILMYMSKNPTKMLLPLSMVAFLVSSFISGFILGRFIVKDNFFGAIISQGIFSAIILIICLIIKGNIPLTLMNILCGSMVFIFSTYIARLLTKGRKRHRRS